MKKTVLRSYARLIVRSGVNVQKGQDVLIRAGLDQPEFVKMVVEEAYRAGARKVDVLWNYQPLEKLHARHCTVKTLTTVEDWEKARMGHWAETLPCQIHLESDDPDGLQGINMEKYQKANYARRMANKPYRDQMENQYQWCIAAVPGQAWAKKMFPGLPRGQAQEKLWESILSASRVTEDPIQAWEAHNRNLKARCDYLNSLEIDALHYTADNGTDFTVWMIPQAQFCGGGEQSKRGVFYNPNIPTEECFISPMRGRAEGVVYATKPLSYQGQLIDGFSIRFAQGKAVEVHARQGEELLKSMISMDEGAAYLGECALVPQDSPIAASGLLYYNTLFDENAACHLALGAGYADTIRDFQNKTLEECRALGINESMIHEDFMIGCDTLNIDAITRAGKTVPIFRGGVWAF